jgi:hypothetical protein
LAVVAAAFVLYPFACEAEDDPPVLVKRTYDVEWLLSQNPERYLSFDVEAAAVAIAVSIYPGTWEEPVPALMISPGTRKGTIAIKDGKQLEITHQPQVHSAIKDLLRVLKLIVNERQQIAGGTQRQRRQQKSGHGLNDRSAVKRYLVAGKPQGGSDENPEQADEDDDKAWWLKVYRLGDLVRFNDADHVAQSLDALMHKCPLQSWNTVGGYGCAYPIQHLEVLLVLQTADSHDLLEQFLEDVQKKLLRKR